MEHTPEPWTPDLSFMEQRGYGYILASIQMPEGKRISLDFYGTSFEETEADIHLMAAAPALLATLERILDETRDPNIERIAATAIEEAKR